MIRPLSNFETVNRAGAEFRNPEDEQLAVESGASSERSEREKIEAGVMAGFARHGVLAYKEGRLVFDVGKLKRWSSRNEINAAGRRLKQTDMVKILSTMKGVPKIEAQNENGEPVRERPIMVLPQSLKDLQSHDVNGYGQRSQEALLQPWELGQAHKNWVEPLVLDSGEQTSIAEMAIAAVLRKWQAERGEDGKLMVTHPVSGQRVPFSPSLIHEFAGIKPQTVEDKKILSFDGNPLMFATKYLPHLLESGMLQKSDFRVLAGSRAAVGFNVHERRLNPKAPNVSFSNAYGQYANYYIGRQKIVGTAIKIDPERMSAKLLDKQRAAIIRDEQGKKTIVATFPLLGPEELAPIQESVKRRLIGRGQKPAAKNVSANTVIGERYMKDRVREYSITDFLPPRPGENPSDYYKRIRPLDNVDFVIGRTQAFFQQAGIGVHNLPWAEQLVLSRALLEKTDEAKLSEFAKKYGLTGVRSFLSLDHDRNLGPRILEIGEELDPKLADEIFRKYSEIIDAANQAREYVSGLFPDSTGREEAQKIQQQLLKRGKNLLAEMAGSLKQAKSELGSVQLLEQLQSVKADILLFAATCKFLAAETRGELKDVHGVELAEKDSGELSGEEKKEMVSIFRMNRLDIYPKNLQTIVEANFKKVLGEQGHTFRLLKYNGKITAFFHYDSVDNENLFVGSLNLHPSAKDSPLAVRVLKEGLAEKSNMNIYAEVWAQNPARLFYNLLGFRIVGEIPDYRGTGERYLKLVRPKREERKTELPKAA